MSVRKPDSKPDWSPSVYAEIQFKIVAGEFVGSVVYQNFSEKVATMIVPLIEAITGKEIGNSSHSPERDLVAQYGFLEVER